MLCRDLRSACLRSFCVLLVLLSLLTAVEAKEGFSIPAIKQGLAAGSVAGTSIGSWELAFSPREGAEELVVKVIDSARVSLDVLAYSFTSAPVTEALRRARARGVMVRLVVDERQMNESTQKTNAALGALVAAGVLVRVCGDFAAHHDKTIISDRRNVETGSFNFSSSASSRNSENALVLWNAPSLAQAYQKHFDRNWLRAVQYRARY